MSKKEAEAKLNKLQLKLLGSINTNLAVMSSCQTILKQGVSGFHAQLVENQIVEFNLFVSLNIIQGRLQDLSELIEGARDNIKYLTSIREHYNDESGK